jgi:hypothetical protein
MRSIGAGGLRSRNISMKYNFEPENSFTAKDAKVRKGSQHQAHFLCFALNAEAIQKRPCFPSRPLRLNLVFW